MDPATQAEMGISDYQLAHLKEAFKMFDENEDGVISEEELAKILETLMGYKPQESEVKDIMNEIDENQNGVIDFAEFCLMMKKKTLQPNESDNKESAAAAEDKELQHAFEMFDVDGNGQISRAELEGTLKKLGENLNKAQLDKLLSEADLDGDGEINFEEFKAMMKKR